MSQVYAAYNGAVQFSGSDGIRTKCFFRRDGITTDMTDKFGLSYFLASSISNTVVSANFRRPGNNTPDLDGYLKNDTLVTIPPNNLASGNITTHEVNDAGMLVGDDWVGGSSFRQIGFIYNTQTNVRTDLRLGNYTFAYGINNSGNVALSASGVEGDDGLGSAYTYVMHPDFSLKYLGEGSPRAINDSGQIASFFGTHFAWYQEGQQPVFKNWPKFDLAQIDGIDNRGIIVGSNYGVAFTRAFVASPVDGVFFLDDVVSNLPSGMHLSDAIVDRVNGDIYAKLKTSAGATTDIIRLQSVPEPASISALALGISVLLKRRSRC